MEKNWFHRLLNVLYIMLCIATPFSIVLVDFLFSPQELEYYTDVEMLGLLALIVVIYYIILRFVKIVIMYVFYNRVNLSSEFKSLF